MVAALRHVLIVGAGIVGLSCARSLQNCGVEVQVLDRASRRGRILGQRRVRQLCPRDAPSRTSRAALWAACSGRSPFSGCAPAPWGPGAAELPMDHGAALHGGVLDGWDACVSAAQRGSLRRL